MVFHFIKFEWIGLNRSRWTIVLVILFAVLIFFAVRNGQEKVIERNISISSALEEMRTVDTQNASAIDSLEAGLKPAPESWLDPRSLSVYGQKATRVASMEPAPMAAIATGQSDLFSHTVKPKIYGDSNALGFSELSNPVRLMFGTFDLSFVGVYLLPLIVLAFSYNVLSKEKEHGSMKLTAAQPVSVYSWLFTKLAFRFVILMTIVIVSVVVSFIANGISVADAGMDVVKLILILSAYSFFWFMMSFVVNLAGRSSGENAATLVSIWVGLVLLLPTVISQLANTIYPVPSRVQMINEYRIADAEAAKRSGSLLKTYYHDHPELARQDTLVKNKYSWWLGYFASQGLITGSVKPLLDEYNHALEKQQDWVDGFRYLSPAILLQNSMNDLAHTSPKHYADFRKQVVEFSETWRQHFLPRMFNNEDMHSKDIALLPSFHYAPGRVPSTWLTDFAAMVAFAALCAVLSMILYSSSIVLKYE